MLASAAGGVAGYAIGYFLYASIGEPIIAFYGYTEQFAIFQGWYREYGAWIVAAGGFTPIPYKVITIASGVAQMDLGTFTVVSGVSRGARFFLVPALLWRFGPPLRSFNDRKSVVEGKSVLGSVNLGGRRMIKKKKTEKK